MENLRRSMLTASLLLCTCLVCAADPQSEPPLQGVFAWGTGTRPVAVMAPVREVFRLLGFKQSWQPATDTISLTGPTGTVSFRIGQTQARFEPQAGGASVTATLPAAPRYLGNRLYGPVESLWKLARAGVRVVKQEDTGVEYQAGDKRFVITLLSGREKSIINQAKGSVVKFQTSKGDILLELFDEQTPVTVGNFLDLVGSGYYDGLTFHRVIADFMIQGGCPRGNGTGGPGWTIPDEADRGLKHERGSLSMAKTAMPNTGGSQFFICHVPCGHLDGVHTVFGKAVEGMEVVDAIRQGDTIQQATILSKSAQADAAIEKTRAARVPEK